MNDLKKILKIVSVGFLLILAVSIISCAGSGPRKAQLDNTLDLLLRGTLGLNYKVVDAKYSGLFGFDPGASWWVMLDESSKNRTISILDKSHVPWPEEIAIRIESIRGDFAYQGALDSFKLYELEMALNGSTLCETKGACNYFVFRKMGEANLFVSVVKY